MSLIATEDTLFEEACGTCEVCGDIEIQVFKFACGHWACEGCFYSVMDDEAGLNWTGCDNCEPPTVSANSGQSGEGSKE